jgi:hypothetical protein
MINLIDSIFSPVVQFLDLMIGKLSALGTLTAKGVRLDDYLGFFSILGPAFTALISSLIVCLTFLYVLYMIQKQSRVLLWFKALIKWW